MAEQQTVIGHTPGPWFVDTGRPRRTTIVAKTDDTTPGGRRFVEIADVLEPRNTRLIAAAPEMYAVLKDLLQGFYTSPRGQFDERIHAVLAKAEGRP